MTTKLNVRRRGRSLYINGQHYRFPTPVLTADTAQELRKLESPSTFKVDAVIREGKGRKIL